MVSGISLLEDQISEFRVQFLLTSAFATSPRTQETISHFTSLEDFLQFARGNGIMVKDNRDKGGCVWVKADQRINGVIQNQTFGDYKFKYSAKSKAMGGEPGWYY